MTNTDRATCLAAILVFGAPSSAALACPGPQLHQMTILRKLHPLVMDSDVIAKVEILSVKTTWEDGSFGKREVIMAQARVIEAVKGSEAGQVITIDATPSSCGGGLYEENIGERRFIAGMMTGGVFHSGRWFPAKFGKDW